MIWCHRNQWAFYLRIQYSCNIEITILSYKWKKTLEKEDLADLQNSQMSEDSMKEILTWWGKIPVLNWRQLATAIFLPTGFFSAMWLKSVNFQHFFSLLLLLLHLLILFPLHSFPACFPLLLSSDLLIPSLCPSVGLNDMHISENLHDRCREGRCFSIFTPQVLNWQMSWQRWYPSCRIVARWAVKPVRFCTRVPATDTIDQPLSMIIKVKFIFTIVLRNCY